MGLKGRGIAWYLIGLLGVLGAYDVLPLARAQDYRRTLEKPPVEIYRSMLACGSRGEYEPFAQLVPLLNQLPAQIEQKFGVDVLAEVRRALDAKDREAVLNAVRTLISYDMRNLFLAIRQGSDRLPVQLHAWLKEAYLDYNLLSPSVRQRAADADARITKAFSQASSLFTVQSSPFAREKSGLDRHELTRLIKKIEGEYLKVFPQK
jgi:hypothetical protein